MELARGRSLGMLRGRGHALGLRGCQRKLTGRRSRLLAQLPSSRAVGAQVAKAVGAVRASGDGMFFAKFCNL